jgi:hypothetical protein
MTRQTRELFLVAPFTDGQIVKELVAEGADVNQVDEDGWTPIAYAASFDNVEAVAALLHAGASPTGKDILGSPLVIAAVSGSKHVIAPLAGHNIPPSHIDEAYLVAATMGNQDFLDALNAAFGVSVHNLSVLKRLLEEQLKRPMLNDGQITNLFVLAALKMCREANIQSTRFCLAADLVP